MVGKNNVFIQITDDILFVENHIKTLHHPWYSAINVLEAKIFFLVKKTMT